MGVDPGFLRNEPQTALSSLALGRNAWAAWLPKGPRHAPSDQPRKAPDAPLRRPSHETPRPSVSLIDGRVGRWYRLLPHPHSFHLSQSQSLLPSFQHLTRRRTNRNVHVSARRPNEGRKGGDPFETVAIYCLSPRENRPSIPSKSASSAETCAIYVCIFFTFDGGFGGQGQELDWPGHLENAGTCPPSLRCPPPTLVLCLYYEH